MATPPDDMTLDELRPLLGAALLPHAAFDGWGDKALAAAACDLAIPHERARLVFPKGPSDMMCALTDWTNDQLSQALENGQRLSDLKIRDKVTKCVRTRFEAILGPHKEAIRRGSHILARPQHAALTARLSWQTADRIWRLCGDRTTDFNHYTKRATLVAVLGTVSLYWLADESAGNADTWAFLDRRIGNVMQFEKAKARVLKARENVPSLYRFLGRLRYPAT
jgi:ubiquinone biosynthesis protein COQ9